ncbi:hypothetical protein MUN84_05740 [Hymenobacter sp. 5516J-16]|uniref:hypothetical protein n=1 Tax=Hymenobacter sp. 5516J-16 TaxID=2932253 RepID=UPI001FD5CB0E|nr:hypothetical protein [Hymenobacter sp. 5516J-16]UOQ78107.1 hypothetical protein MUN84_05740 [Hymenobacter sp. 5516J-16]
MPLVVVSVAIASQVTNSYKHDLLRSYQRRGQAVQENLLKNRNLLTESGNRADLVDLAENVAALTETDLNLYDARGELLVSSQPLIFEASLLSTLMNPRQWRPSPRMGNPAFCSRSKPARFPLMHCTCRSGPEPCSRGGRARCWAT